MTFLDNIASMGKQAAIDAFKSQQPTLDVFEFFEDPEGVLKRINDYIVKTIECAEHLKKNAPDTLQRQGIKVLTMILVGSVASLLFVKAVVETLVGVLFGFSTGLPALISLLLAVGGAYISLQLMRDIDANVRYEALKLGKVDILLT